MNVFFRELKACQKSTIIWIVSLCSLVIVFLLMYPAFTSDVSKTRALMTNLPIVVRNALDISLQNFFTIYGFFAYLFTFISLAGAVQAMNLGVGLISKEDSGKTVDFLLSKPISRFKVFFSKLLAAIFLLIITNVIFSMVSYTIARFVSTANFDTSIFLLILATLFLIQIIFLALGILISMIISKIKSPISVSLPAVFSFFIIGMFGSIIGNDSVKFICPFKFYDLNYVINNNAYEIKFLIIEIIFVVIAIIISYIIYLRKDIRAVS